MSPVKTASKKPAKKIKVTASRSRKAPAGKAKKIEPEIVTDELDLSIDDTKAIAVTEESGTGLDALQKYLMDIRKYPLLTPEEEKKLAIQYKETGDRKAAEQLVTANLRFVVKVAAEYAKFGARMIDLIQEGNVGLMHAVREFNPYKGIRLITYAVWWIRGYIQEYLMKNYSHVRIGTTQAQKKLFYHLNREKAKLDALGQESDVKLLSTRLGVTEDDVRSMQMRMSGRDLSLDSPTGDEAGAKRWVDSQPDSAAAPADEVLAQDEEHAIFSKEIDKVKAQLNEKELYILEKRILGDPALTLQEVGDHFGITRERARQLEERLVDRLREHFQKVFPDYEIKVPKN
ncbi:MAG: RNA polymerase factor sigma-32 [Oligoflexia bacterium]|nr:RNA polymerase factor sigma-32 [Oligoflexia bacterium]